MEVYLCIVIVNFSGVSTAFSLLNDISSDAAPPYATGGLYRLNFSNISLALEMFYETWIFEISVLLFMAD